MRARMTQVHARARGEQMKSCNGRATSLRSKRSLPFLGRRGFRGLANDFSRRRARYAPYIFLSPRRGCPKLRCNVRLRPARAFLGEGPASWIKSAVADRELLLDGLT